MAMRRIALDATGMLLQDEKNREREVRKREEAQEMRKRSKGVLEAWGIVFS